MSEQRKQRLIQRRVRRLGKLGVTVSVTPLTSPQCSRAIRKRKEGPATA